MSRTRLAQIYLVIPAVDDLVNVVTCLETLLQSVPIAAVLITPQTNEAYNDVCQTLIPVIQRHGAAALLMDDWTQGADGVHITGNDVDLEYAMRVHKPDHIVGVGDISSRHMAMIKGERQPDYLMFGNPLAVLSDDIVSNTLELAKWWVPLFEIPAVVMAGCSEKSLAAALTTGAEFIGFNHFVWSHPDGPENAIKHAYALIIAEA